MGVAELALEHALLLLLYPTAHFEGDAHQLLQILIRHFHRGIWVQQLEQAAHRLVDRRDVPSAERPAVVHPSLEQRNTTANA